MIRIPYHVTNRFGEPLPGAQLRARWEIPLSKPQESTSGTDRRGAGVILFRGSYGPGNCQIQTQVVWTDRDGVVWGGTITLQTVEVLPMAGSPDVSPRASLGFSLTTRAFPQALPLPEMEHGTRTLLLSRAEMRPLHDAYEEARDSMVAGLPNSAAAMLGKTLETAIYLRGETLGWPVDEWKSRPTMLGGLLSEPLVKAEIISTFNPGFYRKLNAANVVRILGAHQAGEGVNMDDSRAALKQVTQLIDGWFGALVGPPPGG